MESKLDENAPAGIAQPLAGPHGGIVILDLAAAGNYVAVCLSGAEP